MKIRFQESTLSPDYSYAKDQVIDSESVKDQGNIPNWLRRGVAVEVKEQPPVQRAVLAEKPDTKKAVTK